MSKVLFLAHTDENGALPKAALESLCAAKILGGDLSVGLVGAEVSAAADSIAGCGATFYSVSGGAFAAARYSTDAAAFAAIVEAAGADMVVAPATSRMSRCLPGVAQRTGGRIDTNLTDLSGTADAPVATRWFYRQRMFGTVTREARPWFVTLSAGCFEPSDMSGDAGSADVTAIDVAVGDDLTRTTITGIEAPSADEQTIRPEADLLFVAGAGWTKKQEDGQTHLNEAGDLIMNFVSTAKASLGSSKSLVDLGSEGEEVLSFLTHMHQVGQTGATPRHSKGLATCCHGEEPHVVGWRFINERRAVNKDAACGWAHGKADVLYVADAFEVMKKVNELLD